MSAVFADRDAPAVPLHLVDAEHFQDWASRQTDSVRAWLATLGFQGQSGRAYLVPGPDGAPALAVAGMGTERDRSRTRFLAAHAQAALPAGVYRLATPLTGGALEEAALGWLLSAYRFDRYRPGSQAQVSAQLLAPDGIDVHRIETIAAGECLTRDLINTPSSDMGPAALEHELRSLATLFGATLDVTEGDALLDANFPMIHAVGRASAQAPRLIDMRWGSGGPRLTLVGKGVCFDTGGLNLKPGSSMGLMKKDMGGAATVAGLARMIMALDWPVRLRVLVPAVENAVSGASFRPGDILTSRKGLTVEINNTDAEGRLVLADALALADEEAPDVLVSMATLTGAARVAVGPDLAPFYSTDADLAEAIMAGAAEARDPVWQMPFWDPYDEMIEPGIADLDNAPSGGFAGSITAALFLRRFVEASPAYAHFDIYGWQPRPAPARPKGGVGQGARALLAGLPAKLGL